MSSSSARLLLMASRYSLGGSLLIIACILPALILGCPKQCVCRGNNVKCPAAVHFPESFPTNTEKIVFDEYTVTELPPKAFQNLPNLTTLSFSRCNFGQISACAIPSNHKNLKTILFDLTVIGEIKQGAFTHLSPVSITFSKSKITTMKSYAFWNIKTKLQLTFTDTTVHKMEPFAFNNVTSDLGIKYENGRLKHLRSDAFADTQFNTVEFKQVAFDNLECNVYPRLGLTKSLIISGCQFQCTCDIVYMKNIYASEVGLKDLVETGTCTGPEALQGASVKDVLDNDKIQNCPASKQVPDNCQPIQEIPEHVCTDRIIMGDEESNGSGSKSNTNKKGGNTAECRRSSWTLFSLVTIILLVL